MAFVFNLVPSLPLSRKNGTKLSKPFKCWNA